MMTNVLVFPNEVSLHVYTFSLSRYFYDAIGRTSNFLSFEFRTTIKSEILIFLSFEGLPTVFTTRTTYHPVTVTDTAKTRHLVKTTDTTQITTEATTTHHTLETTDTTRITTDATTTQHPLKTTDTTRITTVATATPGTFQRETTPKNIYSSAYIINVLEETTPTSTGNCMCSCTTARQMFWWDFYHGNYTVQEKAAILEVERQRLRSELLVNKSSLTSVIRSRTSAKDERPTAKSIGYIGVVLLICICIIFPCIDLLNFIITKYINKKA